ncbi:nuclease (SNase domain-containing protein) [Cellulophaga algicola DSM 14237]|uniref:Nuclease (SNase domain-containing protein) n=1 Tax=Cellulophaga algicola (strain DSM 14237 / IC166 / ACAM 630) TaxID=688270 RepID=E6XEU6_CELAD|nr:thermonuclease family protein [Cellulophaga algicola]ADV48148.1 nuclease (SNase domain-containing protein) [Cellulophaga algicola DSM 14237]
MNRSIFILLIILVFACKRNRSQFESQPENISRYDKGDANISTEVKDTLKPKYLEAKIIRILDGDTVEVLYGELPIKLRLAHIDCPEKRGKQPFGNKAKLALSDLCFGQMVQIDSDKKFDRNGRLIGVIFNADGLNVNKEMVRLGMAWHYKKYSDDRSYDLLEKEARKNKVGLWIDPAPIAPWAFR